MREERVTKRRRTRAQFIVLNRTMSAAFVVMAGLFLIFGCGPRVDSGGTAATPVSPSGGDWWEVYFTDPARINDPDNLTGSIPEKLIERIDAAEETIDVAAFEADYFPIADALGAAAGALERPSSAAGGDEHAGDTGDSAPEA